MSRKFRVTAFFLVLILAGCAQTSTLTEKKKTSVIMIQKNRISPNKITVQRGTVIVWVNGTSGTFINVYFTEGKKVQQVCSSTTRFFLNDEDFFVSGMIPPGAVASMCFLKTGTYEYMVGGMNRFEYGSITVVE